jgi:hypothetical protein
VYGAGRVLTHNDDGEFVTLEAEIPARLLHHFRENMDA